jgi:hypothetical protein
MVEGQALGDRHRRAARSVAGGMIILCASPRLVGLRVLLQGAAAIAKKCPPHQSLQGRADWAATGEVND